MRRVASSPVEGIIMAVLTLSIAALILLCGHFAAIANDRGRLTDYTDRLFERAKEVARLTTQTLNETPPIGTPCSEPDLAALRRLIFFSPYLRDIGRIQDDRLVCSVLWGQQIDNQPLLPPPSLTLNGIRLWTHLPHPANPDLLNDLAAMGDTLVVTSPTAFDEFTLPESSPMAARITSLDGTHVFRTFGNAATLHSGPSESWYDFGSVRHLRRCDTDYALCVIADKRASGLLAAHPIVPAGLALLALLSGASLSGLLISLQRRRRALPSQLRRALTEDRLTLHYQPLRSVDTGRLLGAEALARWQTEDGRWISPDRFIPMTEKLGLIGLLTRQVVRKVLAEMGTRLRTAPDFHISLNVTVHDLLDDDFHVYLNEQLTAAQVHPSCIVLELTEQSTCEQGLLASKIQALKQHGYRFYIDDFGTGYSNLNTLTRLPVDAIKIDKLFIQSIGTDSPIHAVIAPMCDMARQLRVDLVVEGLEREEQVAYIRKLRPEAIGQGWLFGKPVPAADFPTA